MKRVVRWFAGLAAVAVAAAALPALALEASPVERPAPGKLDIRWQGTDPVDVYVATSPNAPIKKARRLARADRDGHFVATWTQSERPYVILRDARDGSVVRTAERLLQLQQSSNFRDVGGYPAAGGKHVRWGLIYRTGATPMLTDADFAYVSHLGIRSDIDLRSTEERQIAPDRLPDHTGARYVARDYPASDVFRAPPPSIPAGSAAAGAASQHILYREWLTSLAPQYRELFKALLRADGAVTFHCSAGQDRSGVASALILAALGVPRDVIFADYHLSTKDRRPQYEMPKIDPAAYPGNVVAQYYARSQAAGSKPPHPLYDEVGHAFLEQTFDEIDHHWGGVDAYLNKQLGVDAHDIAKLRAMYLE